MTERAETKRHWWVVSPEMSYIDVILDDGTGPTEYYADVVCVEAATKREAIRLVVPQMKDWPREARENDQNPFSGVKAEDARCSHGVCFCEIEGCDGGPNATPDEDMDTGHFCQACMDETKDEREEQEAAMGA